MKKALAKVVYLSPKVLHAAVHPAHLRDVLQKKTSLDKPRSSRWPAFKRAWLVDHPGCAVCGSTKKVEVHHIKPFHEHPELELDENNVITLCRSKKWHIDCHLDVGHNGDFKKHNPHVVADAKKVRKRYLENGRKLAA